MGEQLAVRDLGSGSTVLLVHGGVGPEFTWRLQEPLAERWRLVIPARRGYPPSPPAERQDYLIDAEQIEDLLAERGPAHGVGFSYGGVGLLLATLSRPDLVRSLTLIEPPLFGVAADHPEVRRLMRVSMSYATGEGPGAGADSRAFEALAGISDGSTSKLAVEMERVRRLARGMRVPTDLAPDLAAIRSAGVPALVVSGDHDPGLEAVCDALAEGLGARREKVAGAGHAAQRAPGFNDLLEGFLSSVPAPGAAEPAP